MYLQNNIISDISIIPQPQVCTVQKEIPVEHNVTGLGHHNSICDIVDLSHPTSNEHMDESSDNDLCDHNVMTSDIPDKSDNQQINEHTDISTPSLQINTYVRCHDSFASSVIGSLTSDNTNKYILKRKDKNKSREEIFYQMKVFFLFRSIVGSAFCKSARCP